jgi:hypothetical protein
VSWPAFSSSVMRLIRLSKSMILPPSGAALNEVTAHLQAVKSLA